MAVANEIVEISPINEDGTKLEAEDKSVTDLLAKPWDFKVTRITTTLTRVVAARARLLLQGVHHPPPLGLPSNMEVPHPAAA